MNFNKLYLGGHMGADAEIKTTKRSKVTTGSVAFNVTRGEGDTKESMPHFFEFEAWGKTAEIIAERAKKGVGILIEAHLEKDVWDKDGVRHSRVKIVADRLLAPDGQRQQKGGR